MKKIILFCLLILTSPLLKAQNCCTTRDSMLYAVAYKYILSDSIGRMNMILPSNRLVTTSYLWFYDEIAETNNKDFKTLTLQDYERLPTNLSLSDKERDKTTLQLKIQNFDENSINDNTIFPNYRFSASHIENGNNTYTLRFSPIFDNEFFAELDLPPTFMGGRLIYLFIFNADKTLRKVLFKEIHGL